MPTIGGHKVSGWWIVGGAAGVVVVYYVYKKGSGGSSGSSQSGIDPVTGLPYSEDNQIDPVTGMSYLAEAEEYGSVAAADAAFSQSGSAGSTATGGSSGYYNALSPTSVANVSYSSNAAWSQAATQGLVALGYNAQDVATALGLYLAGQPLGTAPDGASYLAIVQAAVAEYGTPPVGTFTIQGPPSTATTTAPSQVSVPNVVGMTETAAAAALTAVGLDAADPSYAGDPVSAQSPAAGAEVAPASTVTLTGTAPKPAPAPATPNSDNYAIQYDTKNPQGVPVYIPGGAGWGNIFSAAAEEGQPASS